MALVALGDGAPVEMTYAALARDAGRLAGGLAARGVQVGETVAIFAPSGIAWVTAALAIVRAGAVLLPLDINLEGDDLRELLRDADCRRIFSTTALAERLVRDGAAPALDLYLLDGDGQSLPANAIAARSLMQREALEIHVPRPGGVAALLYTSGTT